MGRVFLLIFSNMSTVGHRPGAFSHVNKKHKTGRHRSKGSINNALRGKVDKVFISYYLFVRRLTYDVHLYLPEIALLNLNEIILHFSVVSGKFTWLFEKNFFR